MVLKKDDDTAKTADDKTTELPAGGAVTQPAGSGGRPGRHRLCGPDQAVPGAGRSRDEGGEVDPREVVDKAHVEVAGGEVVTPDPTEPAPGTLLPKDPGTPPQGDQPGQHVPAPQRTDAEGRPLN